MPISAVPIVLPLPREIVSALTRWQALRKGQWTLPDARLALAGLTNAVQLARDSARPALAQTLQELVLYLGFMIDGEVSAPNTTQWQKLIRLEEAVLAILRAERTPAPVVDPRKRILLLAPEDELWRTVAQRLDTPLHKVERFGEALQLLSKLEPMGVAAVLIDQDFLMDLGSVADRLEGARSAEALGATVIYVNRGRDLNARMLALSSGADASLEGDDPEYLIARVEELVGVRERQDNLRVLVVEDDRSQAMYCEAILRKQGMDVQIAGDSRQALEAIRAFAPDLVLMDLHMPEIDGMQLTALIRETPDLALLPIVFLTGEQDEASRFNALRAGGDDYLTKPVRPRHLVTAVVTRARRARHLKRQFSQRTAIAQPRLLHAGEFVQLLRGLGVDRPCNCALLMCAADSGYLRTRDAHLAIERENQYQIALRLQEGLSADERIAPWYGGAFLLLVDKQPDEELMARAESIRQMSSALLSAMGGGNTSVAVLPLPAEALPSAETMIDLAERTLAVARHAGGKRVKRALAETHTDLPAEIALAIQKAMAVDPGEHNTSFMFQPILPLHGAPRPQYHAHLGLRVEAGGERAITRRQWLPLARSAGHAQILDGYAVAQVLDRLAEGRQRLQGLRIFVAVNADSLLDAQFRRALLGKLAERGLNDSGLVVSIDHSEAMLMQSRLVQVRLELQAARVLLCFGRVGVDVKGSDVIEALRPELIAMDAVSLRTAPQTPPILEFARDRGIEVVGHFIPDAQTLARLFALGIDYGMGSFVGPPAQRLEFDFGEHQI